MVFTSQKIWWSLRFENLSKSSYVIRIILWNLATFTMIRRWVARNLSMIDFIWWRHRFYRSNLPFLQIFTLPIDLIHHFQGERISNNMYLRIIFRNIYQIKYWLNETSNKKHPIAVSRVFYVSQNTNFARANCRSSNFTWNGNVTVWGKPISQSIKKGSVNFMSYIAVTAKIRHVTASLI